MIYYRKKESFLNKNISCLSILTKDVLRIASYIFILEDKN